MFCSIGCWILYSIVIRSTTFSDIRIIAFSMLPKMYYSFSTKKPMCFYPNFVNPFIRVQCTIIHNKSLLNNLSWIIYICESQMLFCCFIEDLQWNSLSWQQKIWNIGSLTPPDLSTGCFVHSFNFKCSTLIIMTSILYGPPIQNSWQ